MTRRHLIALAVLFVCAASFARVLRETTLTLDAPAPRPAAGGTLVLPSFDGESVTLALGERRTSSSGAVTYSARTQGAAYDNATVTMAGAGYVARVRRSEAPVELVIKAAGNALSVRETARRASRPACTHAAPALAAKPPPKLALASEPSAPDPLKDGAALMKRGETVTNKIDLLIAVDQSAARWIREQSDFAGLEGAVRLFVAESVERMNQVLANTEIDRFFTYHLAEVVELELDCSKYRTADQHVDLNTLFHHMTELKGPDRATWERLAARREACCADLFSLLVATGVEHFYEYQGADGHGNSFMADQIGFPEVADFSANVCLVEAVAEDDVLSHEFGHNMGAGHAEIFKADHELSSHSGPQLYDYSSGYYFNVTNGDGVVFMHGATVMAYNSDGLDREHGAEWGEPPDFLSIDEKNYWRYGLFTVTGFFSSSKHTYKYIDASGALVDSGVLLGDEKHDNTRLLTEVYPVIANFRVRKNVVTLVDPNGGAKSLAGAGPYAGGAVVTLKAVPADGFAFAGWYAKYDDATGRYADPLVTADGSDFRNPTIKYEVPKRESTAEYVIYARFIEKGALGGMLGLQQEATVHWLDGGLPMEPIVLAVESDVLPKVTVAGLPPGVRFDAKTLALTGTPTKAGTYRVTVKISHAALPAAVEKSFEMIVREFSLDLSALPDVAGTVKGAGNYIAGKKVTLTAKANKGWVFAGWTKDGEVEEPLQGTVDFRTPSFPYVTGAEDLGITAHFVEEAEDAASLAILTAQEYVAAKDGSFTLDVPVASLSFPKLTLKGLPAGLKFDAKLGRISGQTKKPGVYTVVVSATNTAVKKALTKSFILTVPNFESPYLPGLKPGTDAYPLSAGVAFDAAALDLRATDGYLVTAVAGLPAGLKFNAKSGFVTGIATKPGVYTVTITAKNGKLVTTATVTMTVAALPAWATGVYDGAVVDGEGAVAGLGSLTVSAVGKVSGKVKWGGLDWTATAASYDYQAEGTATGAAGGFVAMVQLKNGKSVLFAELAVMPEPEPLAGGLVRGGLVLQLGEGTGERFEGVQNLWKSEPYKTMAKAFGGQSLAIEDGRIVLKTAASGAVTATGKFVTGQDARGRDVVYSASCSTVLVPQQGDDYLVMLHFPPKDGRFDGYAITLSIRWNAADRQWEPVRASDAHLSSWR